MIKRLTSFLKAAVYPNRCLACGRLIDSGGVCRGCEAVFNRVPASACPMCGEAANMCECWRFKIKTNGFAAPFFNVGRVQKAFYNFKFAEKKSGAEYFGLAMANAFDLLCPKYSRFPPPLSAPPSGRSFIAGTEASPCSRYALQG